MKRTTRDTLITCLLVGLVHGLGTLVTEAFHAWEDEKYTEELVEDVSERTARKVIDEMTKKNKR